MIRANAKWTIALCGLLSGYGGYVFFCRRPRTAMAQDTNIPAVQGQCAAGQGVMVLSGVACPDGHYPRIQETCDEATAKAEWEQACGITNSSGGSNPQQQEAATIMQMDQQLMNQMAWQIGAKLGEWLSGNSQQKARKEALERQREAMAEYQHMQAELAQQRRWQSELADLNAKWVGPKPLENEQPFQDTGSNLFGEGGGGRELAFAPLPSTSVSKSFSTAASQLRIANCLSKLAAQPNRSPADAKFLNGQAALSMSGQPVQVDTSGCKASAPPAVVQAQASEAPLTQDQATLYMKLFETTNQNAQKTVQLARKINQINQAIAKDKQKIKQEQQALNQLKSEPPTPPVVSGSVPTAAPPQSNALAEAEAALKQAQQAETNDEKARTDANNQMSDLKQKLKQTQNCYTQAQDNPAKAGALMQSCGQ